MSEKTYRLILKTGVFASLISIFLVISNVFFPYIVSKQIVFNIIIEILLVFYIVFIIKYPEYRPRKSLVMIGLLLYFASIVLSLFVSVDFNLSFWGDMERMLGLFSLLHFLALYFIVVSVFRTKKDYYQLFNALLVVCLGIVFFLFGSLGKDHSQSILGNRAYLAAIMLFAIFLNALMLSKAKDVRIKFLHIAAFPLFAYGLIKADISGSHAGLVAGIFVSLFFFSLFSKNKKVKVVGLSTLSIFVIALAVLFFFRQHRVFDDNYMGKALRDFSSENVTLNTRIISWKAASRYLVDNPLNLIFGVGHGNYALIFDKYFDAKFYDYDRSQTYFDRAHNNLIDIGTTTGLVGLLAYLSLMVFVLRSFIKNCENSVELSILAGLLASYFVQNLAVFDSFATYIFLMVIMAFAHFLEVGNSSKKDARKVNETGLIIVLLIIASFFIFNINIRTLKTSRLAIFSHVAFHQNDLNLIRNIHSEINDLNSVYIRDVRVSMSDNLVNHLSALLEETPKEDLEEVLVFSIEALNANLDYNTSDNRTLFKLARIHDSASKFYLHYGDEAEAFSHIMTALSYIDLAIESSPERVPLYSHKSNYLLSLDREEEALETLDYAIKINPKMPDPFCQLCSVHFNNREIDDFFDNFFKCIENDGLKYLGMDSFIPSFEKYFYDREDWQSLADMYKALLLKRPDEVSWLSNSALSHQSIGDYETAREQALMILELDSDYKESIEIFLNDLDNLNN